MHNLFANIPLSANSPSLADERIERLLETSTLRIERIVSHGHASPADFWYDQPQHEWIVLLQGRAQLRFEHESLDLHPGDCLNIPAHQKHRVESTASKEPTLWLAIHYS